MSRFFSFKYKKIQKHADEPIGKNNPKSKEIEIYKDGKLLSTFKGVNDLSRNSVLILGVFVDRCSLRYCIKSNKPVNGFVLRYKDLFVF